ncbi:MAG TPA: hypothetical protein PLU35_07615 [Phycisphaerales bacterium]|nr:hypothetical protein [Phycisphaerales bacterium]
MKTRRAILVLSLIPSVVLAQDGLWEQWFWFGNSSNGSDATRAINLIHLWDGSTAKVLALSQYLPDSDLESRLWTPPPVGSEPQDPGVFEDATIDASMFCGGHSALADGRVLHVGGEYVNAAHLFNPWAPVGNQWNNPVAPPSMTYKRWYPTATTLPDGRVLVCSGHQSTNGDFATIPELYDPWTNSWTQLFSAERQQTLYPFMFVLPSGWLIDAGPGQTRLLNPNTWSWGATIGDPSWPDPPPPPPGLKASAVMYEPGKIMRCGGDSPAVATTWTMDISTSAIPLTWLVAGDMNTARRNHNLVVLPDGKVLALGGNTTGNTTGPVFEAEIFDPATGAWTLQPPSHPDWPRWYHSTAMLLPDGRVVSAGGNGSRTGQIFNPPYITSGAPRPTITGAPAYMQYGQQYVISFNRNGGPQATKACLIRLAATTHGFD